MKHPGDELFELVSCFAHCRDDDDERRAVVLLNDRGHVFHGRGAIDRGAAEFEDFDTIGHGW